jgi:hypothetical protein
MHRWVLSFCIGALRRPLIQMMIAMRAMSQTLIVVSRTGRIHGDTSVQARINVGVGLCRCGPVYRGKSPGFLFRRPEFLAKIP